jgi:hypothetical protein
VSDNVDEFGDPRGDEGIALETMGDVLREMAKVYRGMKRGRIEVAMGNGLTQCLTMVAKTMEQVQQSAALEKLDRLEKKRGVARETAEAH